MNIVHPQRILLPLENNPSDELYAAKRYTAKVLWSVIEGVYSSKSKTPIKTVRLILPSKPESFVSLNPLFNCELYTINPRFNNQVRLGDFSLSQLPGTDYDESEAFERDLGSRPFPSDIVWACLLSQEVPRKSTKSPKKAKAPYIIDFSQEEDRLIRVLGDQKLPIFYQFVEADVDIKSTKTPHLKRRRKQTQIVDETPDSAIQETQVQEVTIQQPAQENIIPQEPQKLEEIITPSIVSN